MKNIKIVQTTKLTLFLDAIVVNLVPRDYFVVLSKLSDIITL
jgi:hypothetical protein